MAFTLFVVYNSLTFSSFSADDDEDITLLSQSTNLSCKPMAQEAVKNKSKRLKMDEPRAGVRREATSSSAGASASAQTDRSFTTCPRAQNLGKPAQKVASMPSSLDHTVDETIKHLELTISRQQRDLSKYKRELSVSNVLLVKYRKALRELVSQVLNGTFSLNRALSLHYNITSLSVSESVVLPSFESDEEDEETFKEVVKLKTGD